MTLYSPKGTVITGTLERLPAAALIEVDSACRDADGRLQYEYTGTTDVYWDGQITVKRVNPAPPPPGQRVREPEVVFVDEKADEWYASQLTDTPPCP